MPINCPRNRLQSDACLECDSRLNNRCTSSHENLAEILTIEERVSLLEGRKESPEVNIVTISYKDYQQLQRLILSLQEKVESHITKEVSIKKKKYINYNIDNSIKGRGGEGTLKEM